VTPDEMILLFSVDDEAATLSLFDRRDLFSEEHVSDSLKIEIPFALCQNHAQMEARELFLIMILR
jgi:hypothetical protein